MSNTMDYKLKLYKKLLKKNQKPAQLEAFHLNIKIKFSNFTVLLIVKTTIK